MQPAKAFAAIIMALLGKTAPKGCILEIAS